MKYFGQFYYYFGWRWNCIGEFWQCKKDFITRRGMKLNESKSKAMIIGSTHHTSRLNFDIINDVTIGGEKLEFCKSIRNFGVDENLNFDENENVK